ncbi:hypothetical protein N7532_007618 [Penicillium argentinense]|uniref:NmrA-like domain-containing protein n=1 Tax=Penicillium argentinense TaxID=1131581 RepID=A0A9W9K0T7_9EURO|nr:uncharacterized protein N7532_007618 [Penicillium argentinense]KAJ5088934.1 hypothetical protein N7532_007618 [Penicillium argentinense]
MANMKKIAVIGGTGAQGMPVPLLRADDIVSVLTRSPETSDAKHLAALPNVNLLQGAQDNQQELHNAFRGVYGAWINIDGAYEIARSERVQHYVWASIEYAMEAASFDEENCHCDHMECKGRVGKFILAQGSFMWANPALSRVKLPMVALCDIGVYNLWIFDNPAESAGIDLQVMTDNVSFGGIARTLTKTTGEVTVHRILPFEAYAPLAEPYPGASVNWVLGLCP